jgi:CAAX prenyl protease-like protein
MPVIAGGARRDHCVSWASGSIPDRGAVLIGSVLFGLEHGLWLAGIVAGLAYARLYRASGNLRALIASHALTNLALALWVLHSGQWPFW